MLNRVLFVAASLAAACTGQALLAAAPDDPAKPVNGLTARAEVVTTNRGQEIRLTLKNVSDKPIRVCTYLGNRTLQMDWTGPDGKKREQDLYNFLKAVRLRPLAAEDFEAIPPGGTLVVGPRGKGSGILLENAAAGDNKVKLTYTNKEDGKQFGLKDVWTGTLAANEVTLTVK